MSNSPVETVAASGDKAKIAIAVFVVLLSIAGFYYFSDKSEFVRLMILLVGVIVGSIVFSLSSAGNKFLWFVKESVREAKKVVWPNRKEALQVTAVVFGFVLIMAIFLWGADKLLEFVLYDLILGWKK